MFTPTLLIVVVLVDMLHTHTQKKNIVFTLPKLTICIQCFFCWKQTARKVKFSLCQLFGQCPVNVSTCFKSADVAFHWKKKGAIGF